MLVLFVTFYWQKNDVFFVEICCIIGNKNSSWGIFKGGIAI